MSLHIKAEWAWAEGTTGTFINVAFWPFVISMYSINENFPLHIAILARFGMMCELMFVYGV